MRTARAPSLRARLLLTFLLPTLALLVVATGMAYALSRSILEDELGRGLAAQAAASAAQLSTDRLLLLQPGDEGSRTYRNLSHTLDDLRRATQARRIFAFDSEGHALV